jgi:hypothetical protein
MSSDNKEKESNASSKLEMNDIPNIGDNVCIIGHYETEYTIPGISDVLNHIGTDVGYFRVTGILPEDWQTFVRTQIIQQSACYDNYFNIKVKLSKIPKSKSFFIIPTINKNINEDDFAFTDIFQYAMFAYVFEFPNTAPELEYEFVINDDPAPDYIEDTDIIPAIIEPNNTSNVYSYEYTNGSHIDETNVWTHQDIRDHVHNIIHGLDKIRDACLIKKVNLSDYLPNLNPFSAETDYRDELENIPYSSDHIIRGIKSLKNEELYLVYYAFKKLNRANYNVCVNKRKLQIEINKKRLLDNGNKDLKFKLNNLKNALIKYGASDYSSESLKSFKYNKNNMINIPNFKCEHCEKIITIDHETPCKFNRRNKSYYDSRTLRSGKKY